MKHVFVDGSFEDWRGAARVLLAGAIHPDDINWCASGQQRTLFKAKRNFGAIRNAHVPAAFIDLARAASCYADRTRWSRLYRIVYRLVFENRNLMSIESDPDIRQLNLMAKAVRRDVHKFHAFVRFRRVECDDKEIFVAWHEPHHFTVEMASPFFARRFGSMNFSILTPKGCAHWDRNELTFSAPAKRSSAPTSDETEDFWLLYYRSIFNPFRLKVNTMKRELPVRHWPTLPEAKLIPELLRQAESVEVPVANGDQH
jgi:uracil-DNA glycosylase